MNSIERHVAGATITAATPFSELLVPVSTEPLAAEVIETWVRPLYFGLKEPKLKAFFASHKSQIDDLLISKLLANFNWRPRTAAAYLVALTDRSVFTTQIGRLLLRSDVCFAGAAYSLALAEINSSEAIGFLDEYLSYYLCRRDLWFDQATVMAALGYLDRKNGTALQLRHIATWEVFVAEKSNWNLAKSDALFTEAMATLHALKKNDD